MANNFSAEQFEDRYKSTRLGNWEIPKPPSSRPHARKGSTNIICDKNGRFLKHSYREPASTPWSNFRSTWEFPDRLTRNFADDYHVCLEQRYKSKTPKHCIESRKLRDVVHNTVYCPDKCTTLKPFLEAVDEHKFDYTPGDLTPFRQQHPTRQLLLEEKYARETGTEPNVPMARLNLGDDLARLDDFHEIKAPPFSATWPQTKGLIKPLVSPAIPDDLGLVRPDLYRNDYKMPCDIVAAKPNERCPSPVVPAYTNFESAKRMHYDNLNHQPLPDCIADLAYRKMQMQGGNAGMALDIDPVATGVGIRMRNAGPTHCTKMKVYRPKTCGVVPKNYNPTDDELSRRFFSAQGNKKMGAMDLAICWDYQPANPADEPRPPKHIDGSNDSTGPAVFNCVKTPRDDQLLPYSGTTGRSEGVFNSTLGEGGFFDKDIMRRKALMEDKSSEACRCSPPARAHSVSRVPSAAALMPSRYKPQCQSTPNFLRNSELQRLREKYLGNDDEAHFSAPTGAGACKRANGGFLSRARSRFCHKVAPANIERACVHRDRSVPCKAFRVGIPQYDAGGQFVSSDSGCSSGSNHHHHHGQRAIVVPRPRKPYKLRNYDIETLVPPFRCHGGGAGEGGYPEHWRLQSVYQHAYKPVEQRRRPLLQTVYK